MALTTPVTTARAEANSRGPGFVTKPMLFLIAALASYPLWADAIGLYTYLGTVVMIWMIYGLAFNLLLGYTGLPSFGHGAFLGTGAYAYGLCFLNISNHPLVALLCAGLFGGLSAGLVACFVSRRRGIYFALLTIACGQVFWFVSMKWHSLTGGEDGLLNLRGGQVGIASLQFKLGDNVTLFYFVLAILALCVIFLWRLVHSPFGKALQAIRMNESRARFVGYNVWLTKWAVFTLSGILAGIAGGLLAISQESAYPNVMEVHQSGFIVMATLIGGGTVSFWGPVIGALVFIVARDLLGSLTETWLLWYGLIFMCVVLFQPEGIAGAWQTYSAKFFRRPASVPALPPPAVVAAPVVSSQPPESQSAETKRSRMAIGGLLLLGVVVVVVLAFSWEANGGSF